MMKKRFSILNRPLNVSMHRVPILLMAIARMHNWCLANSIRHGNIDVFELLDEDEEPPVDSVDTQENAPPATTPGVSLMRQTLHNRVKEAGLKRPSQSG